MKRKLLQMRNSFLIAALTLVSLVSPTGTGASPAQRNSAVPSTSAHFESATVERLLNPDGTLNLNNGLSGTQQVSRPSRTSLGSEPPGISMNIPLLAGGTWSSLPNNGLNGGVNSLVFSGSDLYVGGVFTASADGAVTNLNSIAKFSGGNWSALPHNGLVFVANGNIYGSDVKALAVSGSDLYVGGVFIQSADGAVTDLNGIVKFSGGAWSALPNKGLGWYNYTISVPCGFETYPGISNIQANYANALAVSGSDLYVGGSGFNTTYDCAVTNLNGIAKFSGGAWSALPNKGLGSYDAGVPGWPCGSISYGEFWNLYNIRPGLVFALAVSGSDLYVGGAFNTTYDCTLTNLNNIAKFSGGAWSALNNGLNGLVNALAVSGSDLYVGGYFTASGDGTVTNLNNIAKFSGGAWSALPNNGLNGELRALAVNGNDLYVGGSFTATADGAVTNLNGIAKFSGGAWSALPNNGLNGGVRALAVNGNDLYVGGSFTASADGAVTNLNNIAKFSGGDTDGDGLLDEWETNGITINGGAGPRFIDLPAMGADPNKPDIFLQIDWMQDGTHSHALDPAAIKKVVDAFAASPYVSPSGSVGINLHVDEGPTSILNFTTSAPWGYLSKAHALTHVDNLGTMPGGMYDWTDFQAIKDAPWGFTQSGRTPIFHYVIAAHNHGTTTSSGISRGISASDLIVSLGSFTGGVGSINEQAGTLMHELGHNLNLRHGGGDDVNYKPNYLSIMRYGFQMRGVIIGGVEGTFDYSRSALGALDETNLNEPAGLGAPAASYGTRHYCASTDTHVPVTNANAAIDWNCNGNSTNVGVVYDINGDNLCISSGLNGVLNTVPAGDDVIVGTTIHDGPNRKCDSTAAGDDVQEEPVGSVQPSPLTGYNDWANLKLKGGKIGLAGISPDLPMTTEDDPMTVAEANKTIALPNNLYLPLITR